MLAAVYLFASLGITPTPAILAQWLGDVVVGAERYPCEGHACGCASATECWSSCCCHTVQERLAWAITNGVKPPASVKFSDQQWIAAANAVKAGSAECSMCVAGIQEKLARGIATASVVQASSSRVSCPSDSKIEKRSGFVGFSMSALACKGIKQVLASSVPPALPTRVRDLLAAPSVAPLIAMPREARPDSRSLEVLDPPPRLA